MYRHLHATSVDAREERCHHGAMPNVARGSLALVAAGCLLLAQPAFGANGKQACPQLVDRLGDQSPPSDPAADLRSVALTSYSKSVTVVIGYQGEQVAATPLSGHTYAVVLNTGEGAVQAWAFVSPSGNRFRLYRTARAGSDDNNVSALSSAGEPTGYVDSGTHTVRMSIPYAMAPDILRAGGRLTVTAAVSVAYITPPIPVTGAFFASNGSDDSDAPSGYRLGSRGC